MLWVILVLTLLLVETASVGPAGGLRKRSRERARERRKRAA
jgi:hypothetical protein